MKRFFVIVTAVLVSLSSSFFLFTSVFAASTYDSAYQHTSDLSIVGFNYYNINCATQDINSGSGWKSWLENTDNWDSSLVDVAPVAIANLKTSISSGTYFVTKSISDTNSGGYYQSISIYFSSSLSAGQLFWGDAGSYQYVRVAPGGADATLLTVTFPIIQLNHGGCSLKVVSADTTTGGNRVSTSVIDQTAMNYYANFISQNLTTNYPDGYSGSTIVTDVPPAVAPINWDFTADVTGLKVHFKSDVYGVDPTTEFDWDYLGSGNFVSNPDAISDVGTNDYKDPVSGQYIAYAIHHTIQEFDYTYATSGVYDVGLDTISSNGIHKFTHLSVTVGGTGHFSTSPQNGSAPTKPKAVCGGLDIPCIIGSLFTPDYDIINTDFADLQISFGTHLGFIAYPFTWISNFFVTILATSGTPSCSLDFGYALGVDINYNICEFQDYAPEAFTAAQTILIAVISFGLIFELNKKLQEVLRR